ncbi:MAG: AMP-binding protein, partial [bacterium]|nr:AMP-binding protein [bacterium]
VASGYLNNPELTAEKFIANPFASTNEPAEEKNSTPFDTPMLYRSGDMGRWITQSGSPNHGKIEFLGRIDQQVKIRGFRIELEHIEACLAPHPSIGEVVTDVRGKGDGKFICAYIVPAPGKEICEKELKEHLAARLPHYMIPTQYVTMEQFPLTRNGKIDKRALPEPGVATTVNYVAPGSEMEESLADIWAEILNIQKELIGINTNFFDLGGHSLNATMLLSRVQKQFNYRLQLTDFFNTPTIRGISSRIKPGARVEYFSIPPAEKKDYFPLSGVQKRIYLLQQSNPDATGYNNLQAVTLEGNIDGEKLKETFRQLSRRHEGLRTSFHMHKGEPVQRVHDAVDFDVEYFHLEGFDSDNAQKAEEVLAKFRKPIPLEKAPLLRVRMGTISERKYLLVLETHHIVSDIISHGIFVADFISLFSRDELAPVKLQYTDYAQWSTNDDVKESLKNQESYWLNRFEKGVPALKLPLDCPRPRVKDFEGSSFDFSLTKAQSNTLRQLARTGDVTLYMLILGIFNIFLSRICGQEDVTVGTPIAGRVHPDLNLTLGMFANTLVLWNRPKGESTVEQFLTEVKTTTLEAFDNQEFQFDQLVEKTAHKREPGRNPLFDVMFNFRGSDVVEKISTAVIPGLRMKMLEFGTTRSKFDLTLYVQDNDEHLHFIFSYRTRLFSQDTIERFAGYFQKIIGVVSQNTQLKISEIQLMEKESIDSISNDFNEDLEDE